MWRAGIGRDATTKEEIFNSVSVELLCDFIYATIVSGLDDKKRDEFDESLEGAGMASLTAKERRKIYIEAMRARGDVGGAS